MARDWVRWHEAYADPGSALSRRLRIVQELLRHALDSTPRGPIRVLSLCAGDGRDVAGAAGTHSRSADVTGALVELDGRLAGRARVNLAAAGLRLEVRCADAGRSDVFRDLLPVDVLLFVGVFGNLAEEDVARTIAAVPQLCRPGATVIWTQHRRPPDRSPSIRAWFDRAGCAPVAFRSPGPGAFAVGSERFVGGAGATSPPRRLFTFLPSPPMPAPPFDST